MLRSPRFARGFVDVASVEFGDRATIEALGEHPAWRTLRAITFVGDGPQYVGETMDRLERMSGVRADGVGALLREYGRWRPDLSVEMACRCLEPGETNYRDFDASQVGVDPTAGRYGEVTIPRCLGCGQHWLRYFVEYEGFTGSGRFFRAPLDAAAARAVLPRGAVAAIEEVGAHIRGGSYFGAERWSTELLYVDL